MQSFIGKKDKQSQVFLEDGTRIPVTQIMAPALSVVSVKTKDKHGYLAMQLGFGTKKNPSKALLGQIKGANLQNAPLFLREIAVTEEDLKQPGETVSVSDVFKPGDMVHVMGISKGKGFAGVVKRHGFKGGPRTHGQSDRERAPGSIGQTTTPGRVYKGKRMAGRMGQDKVTIKNLQVMEVADDVLTIKGLVPGGINTLLMVKKVAEGKKFIPMYKKEEVSKEDTQEKGSEETKAPEKVEKVEETKKPEKKEPKKEEKENASK